MFSKLLTTFFPLPVFFLLLIVIGFFGVVGFFFFEKLKQYSKNHRIMECLRLEGTTRNLSPLGYRAIEPFVCDHPTNSLSPNSPAFKSISVPFRDKAVLRDRVKDLVEVQVDDISCPMGSEVLSHPSLSLCCYGIFYRKLGRVLCTDMSSLYPAGYPAGLHHVGVTQEVGEEDLLSI